NVATSGGGIRNHYRMTMEDDTVVLKNEADRYGGVLNDGILVVRDSLIDGNAATGGDGGGVYSGWAGGDHRVDGQDVKALTIVDSRVVNNHATGDGGGVYCVQLLEIVGSTFAGNTAGGNGGGVYSRSVELSDQDNRRGTALI